ncbi:MAG: endonuclease/exonuclease/phosphatase family protein [Clostridia bacterium]|nr:endonuclease/exonuclease/phosphatase family protein [Clostridia bacterium]
MRRFRNVFRVGVLFLALCSLLTALGCTGNGTSSTDQTGTQTPTLEDDGRTKLVQNGIALYTVVYPDSCSSTVTAAMERFVSAIEEATGVTPPTKSDYLKRGAVYDTSAPEILFGRTDYSETSEALKGLQDDQFTIRKVGNKIVVASPKDVNLDAAVTYFKEHLLQSNLIEEATGMKTLYFEEYTSVHQQDDGTVLIGGAPLTDFVIVYETERTGYMEVAVKLRDLITEMHGVTLRLYADSNETYTESANEILIGKTNRALSAEIWAQKVPKLMTYEAVVRSGKLQIVCGGPYSASACVDHLRFGISASMAEGEYYATNLAAESSARSEDTDLRLMTSNVLAAWWGEQTSDTIPPVAQRAEIFAAVLAVYQPDVIGVQETDPTWLQQFPSYVELLKTDYGVQYTWLFTEVDGLSNLTSMLYRSDKYNLKASDAVPNSYWPASSKKYHLRIMDWVYLEEKTNTANKFIVVNTHWAHESADWIAGSVNEEIEMVNSLRNTYGVPIFCTGDFNSKTDSAEYNSLVSSAGVTELFKQAKAAGTLVNECGGCGTVGTVRTGGNYIDHIFGTGAYSVQKYETVVGNRIQWLSDHAPHFADIKFN